MEAVIDFIFLGSKITAGSDCSHEIKRCLLLGRKPMANLSSVQFILVAQLCPTLCDPMNCSTPGFPVLHHHPEIAETHVHRVSDAIQPSRPLLSAASPAFSLSQHQGLFQGVSSLHQVAKYRSFSFSISLSNDCSGLVSFRIDWFDLLAD